MTLYYWSLSFLSSWLDALGRSWLLFIGDNLSRWCLLWIQSACPHIQMSVLIAEPKLEGQTVPFSQTTPTGYDLIKIQTHSTGLYAVQVVLTVCQRLSLYLQAWVHPHFSVSTSISVRLLVCLIGCMSAGIHEWVGSCHVLVSWSVTFVTFRLLSHPPCLLCLSTAQTLVKQRGNWFTWLPAVSNLEHENMRMKREQNQQIKLNWAIITLPTVTANIHLGRVPNQG